MKKMFIILTTFLAVVLVSCLGADKNNSSGKEQNHNHNHSVGEDQNNAVVVLKNDELHAVYEHYVRLTNALTNNSVAEAKIAANAIEAGAKEIKGAKPLAISASKITAALNIEGQRMAYSQMSKHMEALIKREGLSSGQLYVDFCPMALKDQGAIWISNHKDIRNPYFGEEMLACGEVQDTIK